MVNETVGTARRSERALILSYAPAAARTGLAALLALDDRLGAIVRAARDPLIGAMRLTWWYEALERLDTAPPPAEPLLQTLAATVLPRGVGGATLASMVDGWERLLGEAPGDDDLPAFGRERGGRLFAAAATVLGATDPRTQAVGEGWALADLAGHWTQAEVAARAAALAQERLERVGGARWPVALRPLGGLALLARSDLGGGVAGSPKRVARLLVHRLSGR